MLTQCTRPGDKFPPSFFYAFRDMYHYEWTLKELKGTVGNPSAGPLSEADHLNGVQWRGVSYFKTSSIREFSFNSSDVNKESGPWSDWRSITYNPDNLLWPELTLEKRNDQWRIKIDLRELLLDFRAPSLIAQYRVSCATAIAPNPFEGLAAYDR